MEGSKGLGRQERPPDAGWGASVPRAGLKGWRVGASPTRSRVWGEVRLCRKRAGEGQLAWPLSFAPSPGDWGASLRTVYLLALRLRAWLPPHPPKSPEPRQRDRTGVLTSALTSASSAAAPWPRKPSSSSSSGSSRGRTAASRPPGRLLAQAGGPGALGSLPMLSAPSPARSAARGARPSPAPGPRTRLGNLRRSLAARPAGARQTSRFWCRPEPLRYPRQIPTLEKKRAGQIPARGAGPRARGPPPGPAAGAPGARLPRASATPEPLSGSALRPPGSAAPPARPAPSVHARGRALPRARASLPGTLLAQRPTGPGSPRGPGRRRRELVAASERASQGTGARRPRRVRRSSRRSRPSSQRRRRRCS